MSVRLKFISHRRERGLSKNGSKENEEVGGHQGRVSVQTKELDLGAGEKTHWLEVHTGLAEFTSQHPCQAGHKCSLI